MRYEYSKNSYGYKIRRTCGYIGSKYEYSKNSYGYKMIASIKNEYYIERRRNNEFIQSVNQRQKTEHENVNV